MRRSRFSLPLCALMVAGLLLLHAWRLAAQIPSSRDWNRWPCMSAQIPASVQLSGRVISTDSGRAFQSIIVFRNPGPDSVRVRFGSCSFGLRLYRDSSLRAEPVWDNRPVPNAGCTLEGHELWLGPNEQREQAVSLGFDLLMQPPKGPFFATITWRPSSEAPTRDISAGAIVIP